MNKIDELERRMDKIQRGSGDYEDEKTRKFKFKDRRFKTLAKKSAKKPDYVLVQYLRNNKRIDFKLCKVISGNIIVIDNKGHELNPKSLWIHGKYVWYIIREKDTKPVSVNDKITGWKTDDHPILMKMVLGAIQKKEEIADKKKIIGLLIGAGVVILILWIIFGG